MTVAPVPQWADLTYQEIGAVLLTAASWSCSRWGGTSSTVPIWARAPTRSWPRPAATAAAGQTGDLVLPALAYGRSLGSTHRSPGTRVALCDHAIRDGDGPWH